MMKESCHGETAREMLCSTQPFPICSFLQLLTLAPAPAPAMLPKPEYQGAHRPKRHAPGCRWPSSATSLSINLNPFSDMLKKKGEKLSFCFPASSHPVPLPPPPWDCSVPPPCTRGDDAPCPPTREAWAFKHYIARRH